MEHIFSIKHSRGVKDNKHIFNEIDNVIRDIDEFQNNKKIIEQQRGLERGGLFEGFSQTKKMKSVLNPELTNGTEDPSSGASKTTTADSET